MMASMCPHCGRTFSVLTDCLIPWHNVHPDDPGSEFVEKRALGIPQACPGVGQGPRNPESDRRPLWMNGGVR